MKHTWSEPSRTVHLTTRVCQRCGLIRLTRHEPATYPWTEWWRGETRLWPSSGTPECQPVEVDA